LPAPGPAEPRAPSDPLSALGRLATRRAAWVCALLVLALAALAYHRFLLLDQAFLFTDVGADTVNGMYPRWVHLAETLRAGHLPGWTFRLGLGQNVFPNSLGDPFDLAVVLSGRPRIPYAMAYMEVAKLTLAGGLFCAFLRAVGLAPLAALLGGVLYAFSGFMVVGGSWTIFSTEGVHLALLLLAFERYRARGRWGLLVLAFFLIAAGRPVNLLSHGLFLALYAAVRHVDLHGWAGGGGIKGVAGLVARLAGFGALGAAAGGVFMLPILNEMLHSHRVSGVLGQAARSDLLARSPFAPAPAAELKTALLRLFGNDLLGRGTPFKGTRQYLDAPLLYAGLPTLLLAPQAFVGATGRRRAVLGGALALALVLVVFPYPRSALWAFAVDYYRVVGFLAALVPLLLAAGALSRILRGGRVHLPLLGATLAVLAAALLVPWPPDTIAPDLGLKWATAGALAAYAGVIALLGRARQRPLAAGLLVAMVAAEVLLLATPGATKRPVVTAADLHAKTGYNDYAADAAAWLRQTDPGLYRVEKTFSSSPSDYTVYRNDPMVQGYRGTSAYHRFNNPAYLKFLVAVGATDLLARTHYRVAQGLARRPLLHPFLGVRYLMSRAPDVAGLVAATGTAHPDLAAPLYQPVATFGDVTVFRDRLALPIAFTYDHWLDYRAFLSLAPETRDLALYDAFVPDPRDAEAVRGLSPITQETAAPSFSAALAARARDGFTVTDFGPGRIRGTVTVPARRMLAFTVPQDPGWSARVDGAPAPLHGVNFGFVGLPLAAGTHTVELCYRPPAVAAGAAVSGAGLLGVAALLIWGRRRRRAP